MKKIIIAVLLITSSTLAQNAISRYEIIAATLWNPAENRNIATIIRIDTITGQAWRLTRSSGEIKLPDGRTTNVIIEGWQPIEENIANSLADYQKLLESTKSNQQQKTTQEQ